MKELDLSLVGPMLHDRALEDYLNRDIIGVLCKMENTENMEFVWQNHFRLIEDDLYEEALLHAYTSTRTSNYRETPWSIWNFFSMANRERLRAAGDPLPEGETFTVYRGIATRGNRQTRIKVPSWTDDFDLAVWFAKRHGDLFPNKAVYKAIVQRDEVLAYTDGREENEFIVFPKQYSKVKYDFASEEPGPEIAP